jgi:hypothetical protein
MGAVMTSSCDIRPTGAPRRGYGSRIFLIAMGLALATSGSAILSTVGAGKLQHAIQLIGLSRGDEIVAEQRRQAETVAQLEDNLQTVRSEVAMLRSRAITAKLDIADHLARLDAGLARITTVRIAGWNTPAGGPSHEEVDELRINLAMAGIEIGALRSSLDATQQAQQREFGDIAQRVERLEHVVRDPDVTASIPATASQGLRHQGLRGWSVRKAKRGSAIIARRGATYRVKPGTVVPGIGRVSSVQADGSRWIVITEKGIIVQR